MDIHESTLAAVKVIIVKTLGIEDRVGSLKASTPLFGGIPEFDSLAVVELATSLEKQFGFELDGSEFSADIFESIGTLAAFVEKKIGEK